MAEKCTLVSLFPFEILEKKPGLIPPAYFIEASDGETPTITHVGEAFHYVYLDESRPQVRVFTSAEKVARSVVEDFTSGQLGKTDTAYPALTWLPGELSVEEITRDHKVALTRIKLAQRAWGVNICMIADNDWAKRPMHSTISNIQRKFGEMLGYKTDAHPWMSPVAGMSDNRCIACGQMIQASVIVCPFCRAIQDKERAKELQFA